MKTLKPIDALQSDVRDYLGGEPPPAVRFYAGGGYILKERYMVSKEWTVDFIGFELSHYGARVCIISPLPEWRKMPNKGIDAIAENLNEQL